MRRRALLLVASIAFAVSQPACQQAAPPAVADPDLQEFAEVVYPVLLRDCAFPACHGSADRFFRVHGPGRSRLDPDLPIADPVSEPELQLAYDRARSMTTGPVAECLLLRKPLALDQGGAPHGGLGAVGVEVYRDVTDPGYRALADWIEGGEPL